MKKLVTRSVLFSLLCILMTFSYQEAVEASQAKSDAGIEFVEGDTPSNGKLGLPQTDEQNPQLLATVGMISIFLGVVLITYKNIKIPIDKRWRKEYK